MTALTTPAPGAVSVTNFDTASPNLIINHLGQVELKDFLQSYSQNKKKAFNKRRIDMAYARGGIGRIVKDGGDIQEQQAAMVVYEFLITLGSNEVGAARLQDLHDRWPQRFLQASMALKKKIPEDLEQKDLNEVADCAMSDLILEVVEQYSWGDWSLGSKPVPFGSREDPRWNYM